MNTSTGYTKANPFPLDLFKIVEDYFERMLEEVGGMKCLVLDRETSGNHSFSFQNSRNHIFDLHSISNSQEECLFD